MVTKQKIIQNTKYLSIAYIFQKLLAFIYFVFIARLLGVDNVGQYTLAMSFTTMFAVFIDLGTTPILTREIAKDEQKCNAYLSSVYSSKFIISIVVYFIIVFLVNILNYSSALKLLIYVSGFVMIVDSFVLSTYGVLRGLHTLKYESIGIILNQTIAMIIGILALIFILQKPIVIILAFLIGSLVNLIFALYNLKNKYSFKFQFGFSKKLLKHLYKLSFPFALSNIFTRVYTYIDTILLKHFLGNISVGLYGVAYKIPFSLQFIPNAFSASIYPAMSTFFVHNHKKLAQTWELANKYLTILSIPMVWGIFLLSKNIILKFYGIEYQGAVNILKVLSFGLFFIFANYPLGALLAACNKQKINTILVALTACINIVFNLVLIPLYGPIGSAFSFVISQLFLYALSFLFVSKIIYISLKNLLILFFKVSLSTYIMGLFVLYFNKGKFWFLSIIIGMFVYAFFILMLRVVRFSDIKLLLAFRIKKE